MIEDFIKEKIRKLTLEVTWGEGRRESEKVTFVLFIPADTTTQEFQQGGQTPGAQPPGTQRPKWFNTPPGQQLPGPGQTPPGRSPAFGRGVMNVPVSGGN
jgi:hypothetical protein